MVTVAVENGNAVFDVAASHKLWALKSRIEIPLEHITSVALAPDVPMGWFDGIKVMGADLPHIFRAGTFWLHGSYAFFDVRHPDQTISVELENEHFARLYVDVEDPAGTVRMLQGFMRA